MWYNNFAVEKSIAGLCNGSTTDFESVCPGSNPGSASILFWEMAKPVNRIKSRFLSNLKTIEKEFEADSKKIFC